MMIRWRSGRVDQMREGGGRDLYITPALSSYLRLSTHASARCPNTSDPICSRIASPHAMSGSKQTSKKTSKGSPAPPSAGSLAPQGSRGGPRRQMSRAAFF
ncbi:unnamed protein product [Prorocentrum cordatum]|uniref:Uncharacterized protein n=1 Tax=Prorocentrum cordatum TaxID=2364126 RepID=A0ABN9URB8_9DINO|nr:unnamed protein product [Polarella glacialis]